MKQFWSNNRFLILRRFTQLSILFLYFGANAWGWWILRGNLSSSVVINFAQVSDPYAVLQMLAAGATISLDLFIGAATITVFYFLVGGRAFCSWVCPINMVTETANYLRRKFEFNRMQGPKMPISRNIRYWVLGLSLVVSFVMGMAAFEFVSPISMIHRGIVFGLGFGWASAVIIFLFDLFVLKDGWCGHICPLGGFYALLGRFSVIRVFHEEGNCTLCMKCKVVCPEHQVLHMIGKESMSVNDGACTNCARCIDVCDDDALGFSLRELAEKNRR